MKMVKLGNVCEKIGSGATPRGGDKVYQSKGVALIRSQNVYNDGFRKEGLAFIGIEHADELAHVTVQSGDILLNITGDSVARVCQVPDDVLPARVNQHVAIIRPNKEVLDARYLRYFLVSPNMQQYMLSLSSAGGTRNALTKGMIEDFKVSTPTLPVQRAIARVLGTLDDKIELNRRMNQTLEAMAQALFKSWFVDFDPVRAKAEGRRPEGMDDQTAEMFPDEFEDSILGPMPEGWQAGKISGIASINRAALNPSNFPTETFDHYSIPAFDEGKLPKAERGDAIKSNKFFVPPKSVLLSKLNPRIPRVWMPSITHQHRSVCSTEFLVIIPILPITIDYLYNLFTSTAFTDAFATMVTGTSGSHQRVKQDYFLAMDCFIPPKSIILAFSDIVSPMSSRIARNINESRTLASIRDTLLSKLLSGEIRVKGAEKFLEAEA